MLDFRSGVLGAVAAVDDQAGDCDVLVRVEGDDPAVGLLLAVDVRGPGLGVDVRPEPEPLGRPFGAATEAIASGDAVIAPSPNMFSASSDPLALGGC